MWLSWRPVGDVGELADTCTLMKLAVNKNSPSLDGLQSQLGARSHPRSHIGFTIRRLLHTSRGVFVFPRVCRRPDCSSRGPSLLRGLQWPPPPHRLPPLIPKGLVIGRTAFCAEMIKFQWICSQ